MSLKRNRNSPKNGIPAPSIELFIGTKNRLGGYQAMKKTTRKPLNRMTLFVISILILAIIIAAIYLIGFTPGEV